MKNIFGLFFAIMLTFSAFGFAKDDCDSVNASASWILFDDFLSTGDLEIARNHLRSYCCIEKPTLASLSGKCENLEMGPESPYRYDHLVDVGLRKLDAKSMYPNMEPDKQGNEWKEFLQNTEKLKSPQLFQDMYKKYFIQSKSYYSPQNIGDYKNGLNKIVSNVSGFNLYDKYINYCFVAMMMYHEGLGLRNIDIVTVGGDLFYQNCQYIVNRRIEAETNLAISISQYNAATLLVDGFSAYTKQFVQNRLMKLSDKFVAISSLFNTLARQAPLSRTCTK